MLSAILDETGEFLFSLKVIFVLFPHPQPSHNAQHESKLCCTGTLLYCTLHNFPIIIVTLCNMTVHEYNV